VNYPILLLILSFVCCTASEAQNIYWQEDFSKLNICKNSSIGWVCNNTSASSVDGKLRIQETGKKTYGSIYRYIGYNQKVQPPYRYLQIKCGLFENPLHKIIASNANTSGKKFGELFTGWNTFDLEEQPNMAKGKKGVFALRFTAFGPNGEKPGGWFDIVQVRVVKIPYQGITMHIIPNKNNKSGIAKVGDSVKICYYVQAGKTAPKKIPVKLLCGLGLNPYRFSKKTLILTNNAKNGDEKAKDNIFSTIIKITSEAYKFNGTGIYAVIDLDGITSTSTLQSKVDIKTELSIPKLKFPASNALTRKNRDLWCELIKGRKNLALGKTVELFPQPDYRLTKRGNSDERDLTDGDLADMSNDAIWFAANAVAWRTGASKGINFKIDLGKLKAVDDIVIRLLGGKARRNLNLPKRIEVFVSRDGNKYYRTAEMNKLMPGEKNQCDWERYFYVEENGVPFTYPFKLKVNAEARYIGICITGETGFLATDEITVLETEKKNKNYNLVYKNSAVPFITSGYSIFPRLSTFYIPTNTDVPNILMELDMRKDKRSKISYVLELPAQINLRGEVRKRAKKQNIGNGIIRWTIKPKTRGTKKLGVLYLRLKQGAKLPSGTTATFYTLIDNKKYNIIKRPIVTLDFPIIPAFTKLHISLAWMAVHNAENWPNFFLAWKNLGFNWVSSFPRWWNKNNLAQKQTFLDKARAKGFKILMNDSAFHEMLKKYRKHDEIYSQLRNGKKSKNLCPSYRGQFYQKEMERISRCVKWGKPDYVIWDIECWHHGTKEASSCSRCLEKQNKSGKSMDAFLIDCGTEYYRDIREAVQKGANDKMPLVASYDRKMFPPIYMITDFQKVYPKYLDAAQPSLYVCGRALDVHKSIRGNFKALNHQKKIIPWLTTGTYGEFEPYKLEQMILEAFLNGASGITYFRFINFDTPLDFYYHAKALAEIAPYEDLIVDGEVLELEGLNKALTYSGVRKGNQMILLVGNYQGGKIDTVIKLPFKSITQIKDLQSNATLSTQNPLKLKVPKNRIRLLLITGK
jgi:hypothetical protein